MSRLIVVSNRVAPIAEGGARAATGGLAVALFDALHESGGIWFGWSGEVVESGPLDVKQTEAGRRPKIVQVTMDLLAADHEAFYNGYANRVLWPMLHFRPDLMGYNSRYFEAYERVNSQFAERLLPFVKPDDVIWIHDYQLILVARELRRHGLRNRIGFFLHTPFPPPEVLAALPKHHELMGALCHCDLVGFQTQVDQEAFHDYLRQEVGGQVEDGGQVSAFGHRLRTGAFPISIDDKGFAKLAQKGRADPVVRRLEVSLVGRDLIIGVDRLDYSKGLPNRFLAFEQLLQKHPRNCDHVVFLQIAPPSRSEVPEYQAIREELDRIAGRINGSFADLDWMPLRYINRGVSRENLAGIYRMARVGLVTPLRDGMNLVAKEYVAAQDPENPGVLVLSRFAGAARELEAALLVNPLDHEATADALQRALSMPQDERKDRWRAMVQVLRENTIGHWYHSYLAALRDV